MHASLSSFRVLLSSKQKHSTSLLVSLPPRLIHCVGATAWRPPHVTCAGGGELRVRAGRAACFELSRRGCGVSRWEIKVELGMLGKSSLGFGSKVKKKKLLKCGCGGRRQLSLRHRAHDSASQQRDQGATHARRVPPPPLSLFREQHAPAGDGRDGVFTRHRRSPGELSPRR
jgi:hypothetical protein